MAKDESRQYEKMSVFDQIREGLGDGIAQARGELSLRTTAMPAPAPEFSKTRVVRIRRRLNMSQAVFAGYLNVPTKTLQSWEQGVRRPKAGEARLLQILEASGEEAVEFIAAIASTGADENAEEQRRSVTNGSN